MHMHQLNAMTAARHAAADAPFRLADAGSHAATDAALRIFRSCFGMFHTAIHNYAL